MEYFTRDEYLDIKGIDLSIELQDDDSKSDKITRFAKRVTDWCYRYLIRNYSNKDLMNYDELSVERKNIFKEGCIEQAEYIIRNGWLSLDSGYHSDQGFIVDLSKVTMSPDALDIFWTGGFANVIGYKPSQSLWER